MTCTAIALSLGDDRRTLESPDLVLPVEGSLPAPIGPGLHLPARPGGRAEPRGEAMQNLLQDRVIIVVGVGPALGRATALACVKEGAKVVLTARSEDRMAEVAEEIAAGGGAS